MNEDERAQMTRDLGKIAAAREVEEFLDELELKVLENLANRRTGND